MIAFALYGCCLHCIAFCSFNLRAGNSYLFITYYREYFLIDIKTTLYNFRSNRILLPHHAKFVFTLNLPAPQ